MPEPSSELYKGAHRKVQLELFVDPVGEQLLLHPKVCNQHEWIAQNACFSMVSDHCQLY